MIVLDVPFDTAWIVGFILASSRMAAFAVVSPFLGRGIAMPARIAFTVAVALAATTPVSGLIEIGDLVAAMLINLTIGGVLGYLTGLIINLYSVAGGVVDISSGLAVSAVFDPMQGDQSGAYSRLFHLTAVTLFVTAGGLALLVGGLIGSTRLLPVTAGLSVHPGLGGEVVTLTALVVRRGVELALPAIGVLMLIELALGIAARFAPQANVFLLGLPAKLLTSLTVVGSSWALFPDAMRNVESTVERTFDVVLAGLGA